MVMEKSKQRPRAESCIAVSSRIPVRLCDRIDRAAQAAGLPRNTWINKTLKAVLDTQEKEPVVAQS